MRGIRPDRIDTPSRFAAGFLAAAIAVLGIGLFVSTPWQIDGDTAMRERIALARAHSGLARPIPITSVAIRSEPARVPPAKLAPITSAPTRWVAIKLARAPVPSVKAVLIKPAPIALASLGIGAGIAKSEVVSRALVPSLHAKAAGPPLAHPREQPFDLSIPASLSPSIRSHLDRLEAKSSAQCQPLTRQLTKQSKTPEAVAVGINPDRFGEQLATAAMRQLKTFVIYNARYMRISYPMGDVPAMYGVCTDVVIRAYRRLGIDLQILVRLSRLGSGDSSIDHRRVQVLRKFFARYGLSLPITKDAADYAPGDIVTYYRPGGSTSTSHVAVVTAQKSPAGVPMRVHNYGHGVQLDDGTLEGQITGHYRFTSAPELAGALEAELDRVAGLKVLSSSRRGKSARKAGGRRNKLKRARLARKASRRKRRARRRRGPRARKVALLSSMRQAASRRQSRRTRKSGRKRRSRRR